MVWQGKFGLGAPKKIDECMDAEGGVLQELLPNLHLINEVFPPHSTPLEP